MIRVLKIISCSLLQSYTTGNNMSPNLKKWRAFFTSP